MNTGITEMDGPSCEIWKYVIIVIYFYVVHPDLWRATMLAVVWLDLTWGGRRSMQYVSGI